MFRTGLPHSTGTIRLSGSPGPPDEKAIRTTTPAAAAPERTLVLGWNERAGTLLRELAAVFQELFSPEGSEIYLKPAVDYAQPGRPVDFYTILESARRQGHVAIGYRRCDLAFDHDAAYGVKLNHSRFTEDPAAELERLFAAHVGAAVG